MCMLLNGFVLSTSELMRYSLFMVVFSSSVNAIICVFSQCNDSLMNISNKLSAGISDLLFPTDIATAKDSTKSEKDKNETKGVTVFGSVLVKDKRKMFSDSEKMQIDKYFVLNKLFNLYERLKIPDNSQLPIVILFFLIYAFTIVRSKGKGDILNTIQINKIEKSRISA